MGDKAKVIPTKIVLPTTKSEVDDRWIVQKFGMIGAAGIGKSEFWSFANGLYLQTESGLNHLKVMKVPLTSWEDFRETYTELSKAQADNKFVWDTIIIDTIDEFVEMANQEIVGRIRAKFPAKDINSLFDYPAASNQGNPSWGWRMDLIRNAFNALDRLPAAVVFIGHLGSKETATVVKETITIGGQLGAFLCHWPDNFLNVTAKKEGGKKIRIVRAFPTDSVEAKSRDCKIQDGWRWENPKDLSLEARMESSGANFKKMRGLFK